jgi:hypothetical protein
MIHYSITLGKQISKEGYLIWTSMSCQLMLTYDFFFLLMEITFCRQLSANSRCLLYLLET